MTFVNLSVPDLFDVCIERCETAQLECILSCENDLMCLSQCISDATSCIEGQLKCSFDFSTFYGNEKILNSISDCPCQINCYDGCDDCPNPVCQCEVSIVYSKIRSSLKATKALLSLGKNISRTWNQTQIGTCV